MHDTMYSTSSTNRPRHRNVKVKPHNSQINKTLVLKSIYLKHLLFCSFTYLGNINLNLNQKSQNGFDKTESKKQCHVEIILLSTEVKIKRTIVDAVPPLGHVRRVKSS